LNINLTKTGATYNTKRAAYYPNIGEQLDLLYHAIHADEFGSTAKTSTFYTELKAVKDKYPKS
jgi:hypothetical protein